MDSVRFGRVLGIGARLAAKTVVEAVDAATAPDPKSGSGARSVEPPPQPSQPSSAARSCRQSPITPVSTTPTSLREGSRRFGQAVWTPFARLSGVLWLEITGLFFGLFALSAAVGAWRLRGQWHRDPVNPDGHTHLLMTAVVALLFSYFCVSSFHRARSRSRRA